MTFACPFCGRETSANKDGKIRRHLVTIGSTPKRHCKASGMTARPCRCPSLPLGVVPGPFDNRCGEPTEGDDSLCWYCKKFCDPEAYGPAINLIQSSDGRQIAYRENEQRRRSLLVGGR
ncbi:MAG TPA: hypothetical protein VHG72_21660 [Polyangia bacterium]|nr:hypothetical protein [Polyangia bacterium]